VELAVERIEHWHSPPSIATIFASCRNQVKGGSVASNTDDVLLQWDTLPFEELLGLKATVIELPSTDGSRGIVLALDYPPGFRLPSHKHSCGHVEVVLAGSLDVGGRHEVAGDIRVVPAGAGYGPLVAGPDGCRVLEFFPDRSSLLGEMDDPGELLALLEGLDPSMVQGATQRLLGLGSLP
jgi:hypothetical protein